MACARLRPRTRRVLLRRGEPAQPGGGEAEGKVDARQYVARVLRHAVLAARFEEGLGAAVGTLRVAGRQRELDPAQLDVGRLGGAAPANGGSPSGAAPSPTKVPSGRCKPAEKAVSIRAILWMRLLLWREPQEGGSGPVESASEGIKAFHKLARTGRTPSTQALSLCKIVVEIDDDAPRGRLVLPC